MTTKVYRYGLLPPTKNAALVREQMRLAHRYQNDLTMIERGRRDAVRRMNATLLDMSAEEAAVDAATAELDAALLAVREVRAAARGRVETAPMRERVKAARVAKRDAVSALRARRAVLLEQPALVLAQYETEERARELATSAREHCGVYWGTYLLVEAAVAAARSMPLYGEDGREPNDPRYHRWQGEGRIGVQIQKGMPAKAIFGGDSRLRVAPVDPSAWYSEVRGERRRLSRTTLSIRVGSEGRDPVWAMFPMIMHRPFPEGATIKAATVSLRKIGPREEWSAEIIVSTGEDLSERTEDAVAIDVGWRLFGDEIRVAVYESTTGEVGEFRLPADIRTGLKKVDSLAATRDNNFNEARALLVERLGGLGDSAPLWLREATKTLARWCSQGRLAALALRWRTNRFDGDAEAYGALERWRYHDHHLWAWQESQRKRVLRHRHDIYLNFAADLRRRYGTVVMETFDLRQVARRQPTEAEKAENDGARSTRQIASISELRSALKSAFGSGYVEVDAANTTRTCHACGHIEKFDAAAYISHACSSCKVVWDQDVNAAAIILRRWRERPKDAPEAGAVSTSGKTESKWAKAARKKEEKTARVEAARKALATCAESQEC